MILISKYLRNIRTINKIWIMKSNIKILFFSLIILSGLLLFINSCKDKENPVIPPVKKVPVVATLAIFNIGQTSAMSGGNVTSDGEKPVTERGICWSTTDSPTVANSKTSDGNGTGNFGSAITGLNPGTKYYVRAYATNSDGTGYGSSLSFSTNQLLFPELTTSAVSSITISSAKSGGIITSDGGVPVTERGVCWNTSPTPVISGNHTSDGTGTGSFTSSITGLKVNTTYYIRAYATNLQGTAYGNELNFKTLNYYTAGSGATDIEGNTYISVILATQEWMVQNLKTTKFNDGSLISNVKNNTTWNGLNTAAYCWYNNDSMANKTPYGAMYNWYAVTSGKLCPTGWHIASVAEWVTLLDYLGGRNTAGGLLKETDTLHWKTPNSGATNLSGFTAVPSGLRVFGTFYYLRNEANMWTSATSPTGRVLSNGSVDVSIVYVNKPDGLSVRCLKN